MNKLPLRLSSFTEVLSRHGKLNDTDGCSPLEMMIDPTDNIKYVIFDL